MGHIMGVNYCCDVLWSARMSSTSTAYTLLDIMNAMKKVATKENIVQMIGTLVAQPAEIHQLSGEIDKQMSI